MPRILEHGPQQFEFRSARLLFDRLASRGVELWKWRGLRAGGRQTMVSSVSDEDQDRPQKPNMRLQLKLTATNLHDYPRMHINETISLPHTVHGLKAFHASFNAPKTALAIILCSTVVLPAFNCKAKGGLHQHTKPGSWTPFRTLSGWSFAIAFVYLILT